MATQPESSQDASAKRTFKNRPPYIVWSPEGATAPVKAHATHKEALAIAHQMAKRHPGQTFRVMQTASRPIVAEPEQVQA
jgi:hypothetical protein